MPTETPTDRGDSIRIAREGAKLDQQDVARAVGVSPGTLSRYESGKLGFDDVRYARILFAISSLMEARRPSEVA